MFETAVMKSLVQYQEKYDSGPKTLPAWTQGPSQCGLRRGIKVTNQNIVISTAKSRLSGTGGEESCQNESTLNKHQSQAAVEANGEVLAGLT